MYEIIILRTSFKEGMNSLNVLKAQSSTEAIES